MRVFPLIIFLLLGLSGNSILAGATQLPPLTRYDGVWDGYGGIHQCNVGIAELNKLNFKNGSITGWISTTDRTGYLSGKIDEFGVITAYVMGFTVMEWSGVIAGEEGYGVVIIMGDDVDCEGAWVIKRRVNPKIEGVHRSSDGSSAGIDPGFAELSQSWRSQLGFEKKYLALKRSAETARTRGTLGISKAERKRKDQKFDDVFYEQAFVELENERMVKATWARALVRAGGDLDKAKALYISARVKTFKAKRENSLILHTPNE